MHVPLDRYFIDKPDFDLKLKKIEVVKCPSCGSNISIGNKKEIVCENCGNHFNLSDGQYREVLEALEIKKNNQKIYEEIYKLFSAKKYRILPFIPYLLLVIQIFLLGTYFFAYAFQNRPPFLEHFYNFVWYNYFSFHLAWFSFIISILIFFITRNNIYNKNISELLTIFSPLVKSKDTISCRNCGANLKYEKIPDFVVCPYCKSENVVLPNSSKKIKKKLDINLIDLKILHTKYRKHLKKFTINIAGVIIVFYIFFIIFTIYANTPEHIHPIVKYILIPFVLYILLRVFAQYYKVATIPLYQIIDFLPASISIEFEDNNYKKLPKYIIILNYLGIAVSIYYFVAQFFVKYVS